MAESFSDAGYATALYGKWHLGSHDGRLPNDHWFDAGTAFLARRVKQIGPARRVTPRSTRLPTRSWKGAKARRAAS